MGRFEKLMVAIAAVARNLLLRVVLSPLYALTALNRLNRKRAIIDWTFVYVNSRNPYNPKLLSSGYDLYLSIEADREINDDLLISSFIIFMATYFYICDKRQKTIVAQTLSELAERKTINSWAYLLYTRVVEKSLSPREQKYATDIFNGDNAYDRNVPYGIPPFEYKLEKYKGSRVFRAGRYDFFITRTNDILFDHFSMTMGNEIVLLPITLGMMNKAIADRISEDGKQVLYKSILDFLSVYSPDSSKQRLLSLANEVLIRNRITM